MSEYPLLVMFYDFVYSDSCLRRNDALNLHRTSFPRRWESELMFYDYLQTNNQ